MNPHKVLVGSPVCQTPAILARFLASLKALNRTGLLMDYMFVDDNKEDESSRQLERFERSESNVTLLSGSNRSSYVCDEGSHHWDDSLMLRVANYKNDIIQYAIDKNYDALFFVDSDLLLHPDLILHLLRQGKEIVSEIFWTSWHEGQSLEPNVWLFDEYDLVPKALGEELGDEERNTRQTAFLKELKAPGLYEVGGLGACTLLKRSALLKGINFSPIPNLTIHGEDRFFCIRAAVLGVGLFVDTRYPAYHIYRPSDLAGASAYVRGCETTRLGGRVTLSMVVRNEEERYLRRVLGGLVGHIDEAVIIDDASTDATVAICKEVLSGIPLHLIQNTEPMFANEISLRMLQWEETVKTRPDWILNLDADELVEDAFWKNAQSILCDDKLERCCFRLYDMWNATQYREDAFWSAHKASWAFLLRYRPDYTYQWKATPQHCGRFPSNCDSFSKAETEYRIAHFGWATEKDRMEKFSRYQRLDPGAVHGNHGQYDSILDAAPNLIDWQANEH